LARARAAKEADVRVPVEVADLELQLSSLLTQREQARSTSRLLSLDLKRRLGLPSRPTDEALWPRGDFRITETGPDAEWLVEQALADRPELRAWRAMYYGLGPGLLPEVRDLLPSARCWGQGVIRKCDRGLCPVSFLVSGRRADPEPCRLLRNTTAGYRANSRSGESNFTI